MITLSKFVNLYRFKTNRVVFTLKSMVRELIANGGGDDLSELIQQLERGIASLEATQLLEERWKGSRGELLHGGEARSLSAELDRALGGLDATLGSALQAWGAHTPQGQSAALAREGVFPKGVASVIRLPYAEKAEAVSVILRKADGDAELSEALRQVQVDQLVERVREVHARYLEVLQPGLAPSYEELERARDVAHERFCALVCLVAGRWGDADPKSVEGQALARALLVVEEQNRSIRVWYRRRRRVPSVDPETGEEFVDDDEIPVELEEAEAPEPAEATGGAAAPPVAEAPEPAEATGGAAASSVAEAPEPAEASGGAAASPVAEAPEPAEASGGAAASPVATAKAGTAEAAEDADASAAAEASPSADSAAEGVSAPAVANPPALPDFDAKSEGAA